MPFGRRIAKSRARDCVARRILWLPRKVQSFGNECGYRGGVTGVTFIDDNYSAECFLSELGFVGLQDFRIICFISRRDDRSVEKRSPPHFLHSVGMLPRGTMRSHSYGMRCFFAAYSTERHIPTGCNNSALRDAIKQSYGMQNSLEKFH